MTRVTLLGLVASLFVATGCGPTEPAPPVEPGEEAVSCAPTPGAPPSAERELTIGRLEDGAFVPVSDGDSIPLIFGSQGGHMIMPVVDLPSSGEAGVCARVRLEHGPDDAPVAPGLAAYILLEPVGDRLRSGALRDLLGYDSGELEGLELQLEMFVDAPTFTAYQSVDIIVD